MGFTDPTGLAMSDQQRRAMEAAGVPLDQIENAKASMADAEDPLATAAAAMLKEMDELLKTMEDNYKNRKPPYLDDGIFDKMKSRTKTNILGGLDAAEIIKRISAEYGLDAKDVIAKMQKLDEERTRALRGNLEGTWFSRAGLMAQNALAPQAERLSDSFFGSGCFGVGILNIVSQEFTGQTGKSLSYADAIRIVKAAEGPGNGMAENGNMILNNAGYAINSMWGATGLSGSWEYNRYDNNQYLPNIAGYKIFENENHFALQRPGGSDVYQWVPNSFNNIVNSMMTTPGFTPTAIKSTRQFIFRK